VRALDPSHVPVLYKFQSESPSTKSQSKSPSTKFQSESPSTKSQSESPSTFRVSGHIRDTFTEQSLKASALVHLLYKATI